MLVQPPSGWTPSEPRELLALERYLHELAPETGEQESYLRRLRGEAKTLLSLEHRPEGQTQRVTKQLLYEQGISAETLIQRILFRKRAKLRARQHWSILRRSVRALGALGGLRKYKGHTTRAERMVQIEWAKRANRGLSTALYHLPPCCCLRTGAWFGGSNLENGAEFLNTCKRGVDQYVSLQVLLAIVTFILQAQGCYHAGVFRFDDPLHYGYAYIIIFRNLSQAWALYCLVMLYKGCAELLKPVDPVPKFASVKLIVFATFWQSMALSFLHALHLLPFEEWFIKIYLRDATMCAEEEDTSSGSFADTAVAAMGLDGAANGHLGVLNVTEIELVHNISIVCEQVLVFGTRVADPTEFAMLAITAAQNVMVCFEMFLAAVFHHFIFPAAHFRIRPKHKPDETNKVEDSGQSGSSENDQEVRRPTVGPGEAFLEVFDAREVSHLVTSWYSDRFDGTKRVLIHIRPRGRKRSRQPSMPLGSPWRSGRALLDKSNEPLNDESNSTHGSSVKSTSVTSLTPTSSPNSPSSPTQRVVTNSDPRINTQQFPKHLLSDLDLEVVYQVVDPAVGNTTTESDSTYS